jgi:lysophospholipase L1-like esterase
MCETIARRTFPQAGLQELAYRLEMGGNAESTFKPSGLLGWEEKSRYGHDVDFWGFQSNHSLVSLKKAAERRFLFLGDSLGDATLKNAEILQKWETALSESLRKDARLWVFAVGAYNLRHYQRILAERAPKVKPDVLVLLLCLNDVLWEDMTVVFEQDGKLYGSRSGSMSGALTVWPYLFRNSHLYRTAWIAYNNYRLKQSGGDANGWSRREKMFRELVDSARGKGIKLYAVVYPYFKPFSTYTEDEKKCYSSLTEWLKAKDVPYLDLLKDLTPKDLADYRNDKAQWDFIHPNEAGYERIRSMILDFIGREEAGEKKTN